MREIYKQTCIKSIETGDNFFTKLERQRDGIKSKEARDCHYNDIAIDHKYCIIFLTSGIFPSYALLQMLYYIVCVL